LQPRARHSGDCGVVVCYGFGIVLLLCLIPPPFAPRSVAIHEGRLLAGAAAAATVCDAAADDDDDDD
jgi:hypothetical protein